MTAATLITLAEGYVLIGAITAAAFLLLGLDRIEPNARGAYAFRALILPGLILVWPLVLWRWYVALRGEVEIARYRPPLRVQDRMAVALAIAAPLLLVTALGLAPEWPEDATPVLLEAPQ
ncbi:MAG: hypothetical protein AAFY66_05055 [Pseudomonadota bacterium]